MNLSVRILHFVEGIPQLRGAMSVSVGDVEGGPKPMESIKRIPGGYLIGCNGKLFVVSDNQVKCAEVEIADEGSATLRASRAADVLTAQALSPFQAQSNLAFRSPLAQVLDEASARARIETGQAFQPDWFPPNAKIGDIVVDRRGVQRRLSTVDFASASTGQITVGDPPMAIVPDLNVQSGNLAMLNEASLSEVESSVSDAQPVKLGGRRARPTSAKKR